MTALPAIGVVIPARNAAAYLGAALESVVSQSLAPVDVVVVDDGSDDDTPAIAERWGAPVRCLRQAPAGPAAARNRGITALGTDLVASLDADDLWMPGSLALRSDALLGRPAVDGVFGHVQAFASEELSLEERAAVEVPPEPQPGWLLGTILARRGVFARVGPLAEEHRGGDFVEWLLRARRIGATFELLPAVVLRRRIHAHNLGREESDRMQSDYLRIVRGELARRRLEGHPLEPETRRRRNPPRT